MKTVVIIRHAKSDWNNNLEDFDRPLNDRGYSDAPMMAKILKSVQEKPTLIISSPAKRSITTAEYFAEEYGYPVDCILKERKIYDIGQQFTKQKLEELSDDVESVFVFGHNPDHSSLARYLTGQDFGQIPTCAAVGIEFDIDSWKEVHKANGEVKFYEYPKKHK